jgi:hypothetical protein
MTEGSPTIAVHRRAAGRGGRALFVCFLLLGAIETGKAIELPVPGAPSTLHGYYKNFFLALDSSLPLVDDGVEDLSRARLMLEGRLPAALEFAVHYEHLATVHPLGAGSAEFLGTSSSGERPGALDLDWTILDDEDVQWRHEIDRLYVRAKRRWGDLTLGRQAIGWGVGLLWSPHDLFVAFSPVEIDREFRTGIDAGRLLVPLGVFTELEVVYAAFGREFDEHAAAVRWRTTLAETGVDVGLMGGKFFDDAVAGALATGEVHGAGIHAEATFTHDFGGGRERIGAQEFVRAVVGADYRFPHEVYGLVEYYLNGFGKTDAADYVSLVAAPRKVHGQTELVTSPRLTRGEIFNLGRHYLGFVADWEVHPLLHLLGQGQWNLLDPSAQVGPAFTLSLSDEAELDGGAFFGLGETPDGTTIRSEFGLAPDAYYLTAKIYF